MSNNNFLSLGRNNVLSVVLDEPTLYLGKSTGNKVIRGEVIVNFTKDTAIQGPIALVFRGVQTYYPWREIMNGRVLGKPIETKLHVTELSLLPPNSKGIMPAGVQRFPFEFLVPGSLPSTISIPDRLDIEYGLTATLRKSTEEGVLANSFLDRFNNKKQKIVATAKVRLVRAIESTSSNTFRPSTVADAVAYENAQQPPDAEQEQSSGSSDTSGESNNSEYRYLHRRRTSLDRFYGIGESESADGAQYHLGLDLDEQHDHLAHSFAGRTVEDWSEPTEHGLRYRLSIDRTAIAIGTRVGVSVLLEPTIENITIRSIVTRIAERREHTMRTPGDHASAISGQPETRHATETVNVLLKWAYGYPSEHDENSSCVNTGEDKNITTQKKKRRKQQQQPQVPVLGRRYRHHRRNWSTLDDNNTARRNVLLFRQKVEQERGEAFMDYDTAGSIGASEEINPLTGELLNLKSLDQPLQVGEYFDGRFIMPIPTCNHLLHPTMAYESITIRHWLHLIVAYECQGKIMEVSLTTPVRILDCRLVSEDERQTILPPPPSYETIDAGKTALSTNNTEFWLQRSPITQEALWGRSNPCPCQLKESSDKENGLSQPSVLEHQQKKKVATTVSSSFSRNRLSLHRLSGGWAPPPYSEN
ncbi:hypothetical protein BJV82DRAFT_508306 [Fennellomyces sp. T-0311]|nr:hypothetical protein BJV82DRAFT_508306 [Fennellomyces sp. T-0311]